MTDRRLKQLSYSSLVQLHSCPRKYELLKKQAARPEEDVNSLQSITFAFGHIVGAGLQSLLAGESLDKVMWEAFISWPCDLMAEDDKARKSFFYAMHALQKLVAMRNAGFLEDWEVYIYEGKPALELSFIIDIGEDYCYRGAADIVLKNKYDGRIMVVDGKTSKYGLHAAKFKNSAQALGYSIVLDVLEPTLSSYEVMYLEYNSREQNWDLVEFTKMYSQRARWIHELLLDRDTITLYESRGVFPMHGESCYNYFRECEFLQTCGMSTTFLTTPFSKKDNLAIEQDRAKWQIKLNIMDLVKSQINKGE